MALAVIGSGFGRTGTLSLKKALEQLGFGPCHHMENVMQAPEQAPHWQAAVRRDGVDWDKVFAGYRSQVDWPGAHFWRELAAAYPKAKVVHTVRSAESWWDSFSPTLRKFMLTYEEMELPPHIRTIVEAQAIIFDETFGSGVAADRGAALAAFNRRTQEVSETIPPERLLVFDVSEGWGPLCRFLDVPVPDGPFPHFNKVEEFWKTREDRGEGGRVAD